jgi:hypothetical protein
MNEEEKKAVGLLKALNNVEKKCKIEKVPYKSEIKKIRISLLPEDYGIFEILLNLIEKLQKENEELKNKLNLKQFDVNIVYNDYLEKLNEYERNTIQIQRIKDKIEQLEKNELFGKYNFEQIKFAVDALQELLEGGQS